MIYFRNFVYKVLFMNANKILILNLTFTHAFILYRRFRDDG